MVTKGGYKLIDFGGVDISTSKTISGIYNKIANTGKRIVGCNLKLDTTEFKELTLDVKPIEDGYELSNSIIKVTIGNNDSVIGENQTSGGSDWVYYDNNLDFLSAIEDVGGHNYIACIITEHTTIEKSVLGQIDYQGSLDVNDVVGLDGVITSLDDFDDGITIRALNVNLMLARVEGGKGK